MHQHCPQHLHIQEEARRTQREVLDICFENVLDLFCCVMCCYASPKLPRHGYTAPRGGLFCSCFITAEVEQIMNMHPLHYMHRMQHPPPTQAPFVDQVEVRKEETVRQQILRKQDLDRLETAKLLSQRGPERWYLRYRLLTEPPTCSPLQHTTPHVIGD